MTPRAEGKAGGHGLPGRHRKEGAQCIPWVLTHCSSPLFSTKAVPGGGTWAPVCRFAGSGADTSSDTLDFPVENCEEAQSARGALGTGKLGPASCLPSHLAPRPQQEGGGPGQTGPRKLECEVHGGALACDDASRCPMTCDALEAPRAHDPYLLYPRLEVIWTGGGAQ